MKQNKTENIKTKSQHCDNITQLTCYCGWITLTYYNQKNPPAVCRFWLKCCYVLRLRHFSRQSRTSNQRCCKCTSPQIHVNVRERCYGHHRHARLTNLRFVTQIKNKKNKRMKGGGETWSHSWICAKTWDTVWTGKEIRETEREGKQMLKINKKRRKKLTRDSNPGRIN